MIDPRTVTVTRNNVHIPDSYLEPKKGFDADLNALRLVYQTQTEVFERSNKSMSREWACHNFCYMMGWWVDRTKDCDLNYPQKCYVSAAYWVIGWIVWPLIP